MVRPHLGTAKSREKRLRLIGASAILAIRLRMVDALHLVAAVQGIPPGGLIRVYRAAQGHPATDDGHGLRLALEHACKRPAPAFPHGDDDLPLACLVHEQAAVFAVCLEVLRANMPAEIRPVDFHGSTIIQ